MMLSKMVRVRVRVINQLNKSAGNKSGVYALLGVYDSQIRGRPLEVCVRVRHARITSATCHINVRITL